MSRSVRFSLIALLAAAIAAQTPVLRKGVSVQMPITTNAVLVPDADAADSLMLEDAVEGLREFAPDGGTSLENAITALDDFTEMPDNLFLLTDGLPTQGELTRGDELLSWFGERNRFARLRVHVIAMGRAGVDETVMAEQDIPRIDLVVINLYPFEAVTRRPDCSFEDAIENIDIGGPAMTRAAAKNADGGVTVVSDQSDYSAVLAEMGENGTVPEALRRQLAMRRQPLRRHLRRRPERQRPDSRRRLERHELLLRGGLQQPSLRRGGRRRHQDLVHLR